MDTVAEKKKTRIKRIATFYGGDDKLSIVNSVLLGSNSTQSEVKIAFNEAINVHGRPATRFQMKVRSVVRKQHPETIIVAGTLRCIHSLRGEDMNVHINMHFDAPMEAVIELTADISESESPNYLEHASSEAT